jgi:hypothetical protein
MPFMRFKKTGMDIFGYAMGIYYPFSINKQASSLIITATRQIIRQIGL